MWLCRTGWLIGVTVGWPSSIRRGAPFVSISMSFLLGLSVSLKRSLLSFIFGWQHSGSLAGTEVLIIWYRFSYASPFRAFTLYTTVYSCLPACLYYWWLSITFSFYQGKEVQSSDHIEEIGRMANILYHSSKLEN